METALTANLPAEETAEMEAALSHIIDQIAEVREQMKADDAVIARLKAENAVLKAETQTLRDETRAILSSLRSAV